MNVVPIQIRPHLIPFLFKEFEGTEVSYLNQKLKACKIDSNSMLGFTIMLSLEKCKVPVKVSKGYYVYLAISPAVFSESNFFNIENGKNSFLYVPQKANDKINALLEDIFRIAFQYHTQGMVKANPKIKINEAIAEFMTEYKLDEYGFSVSSIWRLLNRNENCKLSRLQNRPFNRINK